MTNEPHGDVVPTTEEFGARLALIRWRMGWNQKEAALACNLSQASWREWELSGRAPRNLVEVAERISRRTGINDYWIMTGRLPPGGGGGKLPRLDSNQQPAGYSGIRGLVSVSTPTNDLSLVALAA